MQAGLKRNTKDRLLACLDIGSSKTCCFIARIDDDEGAEAPIRVLGIGHQLSRGVKGGTIVDLEQAEISILNALNAAETMAGETVERVFVNLSGGWPASRITKIEVPLSGKEITELELRRALQQSFQVEGILGQTEKGRQLIHSIPVSYSIDGNGGIQDPRGMFGDKLGIDLHIVTAASGPVRNLAACLARCELEIGGFVISPYASGLGCLVEDEKHLGATVIDMGASTTSLAVFYEDSVVFSDIVPVGGQHVTQDIARGLSTPLNDAERLKTLYGHAIATSSDNRETINVPQIGEGEDASLQQLPRSLLIGIIQPRLEETFELVRARLEASGLDKLAGRRVVLTGGAAQLPGTRDLAALILDKQVRIGRPLGLSGLAEATCGPAYATAAGLLAYALQAETLPFSLEDQGHDTRKGALARVKAWLHEHF